MLIYIPWIICSGVVHEDDVTISLTFSFLGNMSLRFHVIQLDLLSSRKQTTNAREDTEEKGPLYNVGGNVN
jgi:hypothetical protein